MKIIGKQVMPVTEQNEKMDTNKLITGLFLFIDLLLLGVT